MSWQVIIEIHAQADIDDAFIWYEEQSSNLGYRFITSLNIVIEKMIRNPYYTSVLIDNVRSASVSFFPYEILYLIDEQKQAIFVIAVGHQHRKPGWFARRL